MTLKERLIDYIRYWREFNGSEKLCITQRATVVLFGQSAREPKEQ